MKTETQKTYKLGDVVTISKFGADDGLYKIGNAIGHWDIGIQLEGIGICGLYRVKNYNEKIDHRETN